MRSCLPWALLVALLGPESSARAQQVEFAYKPAEIAKRVADGSAQPDSPSPSAGGDAHLWKNSDDLRVWFFLREGKSYGEYREDRVSKGRSLEITENYLARSARDPKLLAGTGNLRFIRRKKTLLSKGDRTVCDPVEWTEFSADRQGNVLEVVRTHRQPMKHGDLTVTIPPDVFLPKKVGVLAASREATDWELEFGAAEAVAFTFLDKPQAVLHLHWPEGKSPAFQFRLTFYDTAPALSEGPPTTFTMTWRPDRDDSTELKFVADPKDP